MKYLASILIFIMLTTISAGATSKSSITGYGNYTFGVEKSDVNLLGLVSSGLVVDENGNEWVRADCLIYPYVTYEANGKTVEVFSRIEPFMVGDWNYPSVESLCEIYFVDGVLCGVRLVFDFLQTPSSNLTPSLRDELAMRTAEMLTAKYDGSMLDMYEGDDQGFYVHWADSSINELNFSYVRTLEVWLMSIRYTSSLYWEAMEGEAMN